MGWLLCLPGLCNGAFRGVGTSTELGFPKGRPCECHAVHPALASACHQKLEYITRWHKRCPQVVAAGVGGRECQDADVGVHRDVAVGKLVPQSWVSGD